MEVFKFLGCLFGTILAMVLIVPWIMVLLGKYLDWVFTFTKEGKR